MVDDKYIGLILAVASSCLIGVSFIITKKGLIDATRRHGSASDGLNYIQNLTWWFGITTMALGEILNFAAYSFAPAILVTPLGALSVLIGAILASLFLKEELGKIGRVGCGLAILGALIIVIHAPEDKPIESIDEVLYYSLQPGFLFYCFFVLVFSTFMIYRVVPRYGKKQPLVYLSICSLIGSISVMSCKGFGIALKLTFAGNNQFTHPSTYAFALIVVFCILTQMNYFNKALDTFSTNIVNPIYYVFFTTATIVASVILFQGFNTNNYVNVISLFCGFLIIFAGVYLLNLAHRESRSSIPLDKLGNDSRTSINMSERQLLRAFDEENLGLTGMHDDEENEN